MKLSLTNFVSFITIFSLIASGHGFRDELCKPGYAGYIDSSDVRMLKYSGSTATWIGNGLDTIEWSEEGTNEDMILEIELNAAKNITEIHTGKRTTLAVVKMTYSQDGNEWDYFYLSDYQKNEEEMIIFNSPFLIKYLKLTAIAFYFDSDEMYMDFKIVVCHYNELCKYPSYARYIDISDVSAWKCSGSAALWIGNGFDTIEWSAENNNEEMILEIEFNAAKNIMEIHTGNRTTISLVKMMYSQDGNEWNDRLLSDDKKNEEEMVIFNFPLLIKYLKLMAITVYYDRDETYMDFKIVVCNECNDSLVSELDVDRFRIYTSDKEAKKRIGNIRLSEDWPPFKSYIGPIQPAVLIDLGKVHNITGMIIKGEEGKGTLGLDTFGIDYGNSSNIRSLITYRDENEEYQVFKGTTIEENIRYEPLIPFLARYFLIGYMMPKPYNHNYAMQFDVLGCNIRVPPCSDIINTIPGEITSVDYVDDDCWNNKHLEIKFDENGIYKITSVKVTITDNTVYELIRYDEKYKIIYNYDSEDEEEIYNFKRVGPSGIFSQIETPVRTLKLCMHSNIFEDEHPDNYGRDIYKYISIEVRGCLIGHLPTISSIE